MREKTIEIRWRDMDGFRHVNNAVYLTYLEEVRDEWLAGVLGPVESVWDFVLARVAIDFRRELRQEDDRVVVSCSLERIGNSSVRTRETIRTINGDLAAEAEAVLVARELGEGRSRPLTGEEREEFDRELAGDGI